MYTWENACISLWNFSIWSSWQAKRIIIQNRRNTNLTYWLQTMLRPRSFYTLWPKVWTITLICTTLKIPFLIVSPFAAIITFTLLERLFTSQHFSSYQRCSVGLRSHFFHSNLGKPCALEARFVHGVFSCWNIIGPVQGHLNGAVYKDILGSFLLSPLWWQIGEGLHMVWRSRVYILLVIDFGFI